MYSIELRPKEQNFDVNIYCNRQVFKHISLHKSILQTLFISCSVALSFADIFLNLVNLEYYFKKKKEKFNSSWFHYTFVRPIHLTKTNFSLTFGSLFNIFSLFLCGCTFVSWLWEISLLELCVPSLLVVYVRERQIDLTISLLVFHMRWETWYIQT